MSYDDRPRFTLNENGELVQFFPEFLRGERNSAYCTPFEWWIQIWTPLGEYPAGIQFVSTSKHNPEWDKAPFTTICSRP